MHQNNYIPIVIMKVIHWDYFFENHYKELIANELLVHRSVREEGIHYNVCDHANCNKEYGNMRWGWW